MWRIWMLFDPRRALVAMAIFVFTLLLALLYAWRKGLLKWV